MSEKKDAYALAERFRHYLRVTDVSDGLDAVGRADMTLVSREIRPLWLGMRFWGPAVTMRVLPTNKPMPAPLKPEDSDSTPSGARWVALGPISKNTSSQAALW